MVALFHIVQGFDVLGALGVIYLFFDLPRRRRRQAQVLGPEARKRAESLLLSYLTPVQQHSYQTRRTVEIRGGTTGRMYTVHCAGYLANITYSENGQRYRMCVHIRNGAKYPNGDHFLAQVISLRLREGYVLRKAHRMKVG